MAGVHIEWEQFVANIKDLYDHRAGCEIYIKTVDAAVDSPEKREKFVSIFGNICDKIMIENVSPTWPGYDELEKYFELSGKSLMENAGSKEIKVCPFPFYQMFINSDGTVIPCCADWQQKLIMGNVTESSLVQIWNSDGYNVLQKDMLKHGKDCRELCAICAYPNYTASDNIDAYAEDLLLKYENKG